MTTPKKTSNLFTMLALGLGAAVLGGLAVSNKDSLKQGGGKLATLLGSLVSSVTTGKAVAA